MKNKSISLSKYGLVISLVVVVLFFGIITGGNMFVPMNVTNIFMQNSYLIILSVGMYFCLSTGSVDLSCGSVVAVAGAILGFMTVTNSYPLWLTILCIILCGGLLGLFQGSLIAYFGVPAFIATLGGELVFRGANTVILDSQTLGPFDPAVQYFAAGYIMRDFKLFGMNGFCLIVLAVGIVAIIFNEVSTRRKRQKYGFTVPAVYASVLKVIAIIFALSFVMISMAMYNGMPFILLVLIAIILVYSFIANKTAFGRHVFAVGANRSAARLSGVKDKATILIVFVNAGLLASVAGIAVAGRLNAATSLAGTGYELEAISSVLIAGGARAGIMGTLVGATIMAVLNNGMSVLGLGADVQKIVKGIVLLLAVGFDIYSKSKAEN
ncbi:MAG TPA: sugar ABC transporter permease [Candidatus Pygmaiobacter gallistercoris]|nr:sugar ABC transporter permease [Candidatus Pygmaiobacter gallistercoris]